MQFNYSGERFADLQMLRYKLPGFELLTAQQKAYIYYLAEATLWGRDITFDQYGRYNLLIRKTLEELLGVIKAENDTSDDAKALTIYLKRVWFSNGIYHHYGCGKFKPEFSKAYFESKVRQVPDQRLPMPAERLLETIVPVMFDETVLPKRVNKADGEDLVKTSACNFYQGVTQQEAEAFYAAKKQDNDPCPPSYGLNSTLVKGEDGKLVEDVWHLGGKYGNTIARIIECLEKAKLYAENERQKHIISLLVDYYTTGDLRTFDAYSIEWLKELEGRVDFINGFIEVYGDPLGHKAGWEGIVEYKDMEACKRTQTISNNAQWFEDHSPVDSRFRKSTVKGVVANAICAAMIGGEEYPSTAIGINLPNADWIRAQHGSKSVTITNFTSAYNKAAQGNGFLEEFACDADTVAMVRKYGDACDDLHTDLHECLGHGSGQMLPDTDPDALKAYGNTIEEARADLFGLYYIADAKMLELGLVPDMEAYKSNYYTYIMNGILTQNVRIKLGDNIEEAHMRNRALIANWCYKHSEGCMELKKRDGKTYLIIYDYPRLRQLFAQLLAEVQRIKSEGDYEAAKQLVEDYGVKINPELHAEVLERYKKLNIAPYKGFLNPRMTPVFDASGEITDVRLDFSETLEEQMLRYSRDYSVEI
ncbi:MAG: dihydrofolate reductase [Prevotellaceae bacterium]|nr:dihydrofolate reductase [Prevotellaceae bacterium]MDY2748943.1 dihydrofolate reductase [Prevotella sp.]